MKLSIFNANDGFFSPSKVKDTLGPSLFSRSLASTLVMVYASCNTKLMDALDGNWKPFLPQYLISETFAGLRQQANTPVDSFSLKSDDSFMVTPDLVFEYLIAQMEYTVQVFTDDVIPDIRLIHFRSDKHKL